MKVKCKDCRMENHIDAKVMVHKIDCKVLAKVSRWNKVERDEQAGIAKVIR